MESLKIVPDWQAPTQPFRHTWEGLVNVDQFRWLVRRDMQEHLQMAHDELGARHMRAVGMFDDELRVLRPGPDDPSGPARLNWQVVDYCIDSLLEIGIQPMFTTTFTPSVLASARSLCFTTGANTSIPKDWAAWKALIAETLKHFKWRYGVSRMREWYYEAWNEPNLSPPFFNGTKEDFFQLWKETYDAVKSVDADFRMGGPSTARAEWMEEFIQFGRANGCEPDYIIGHIYNQDSETDALSPFSGNTEAMSTSPHHADGVIRGTRELLDRLGFKGELQWNEWGRTWLPCCPPRETVHEAAFVAKSMAEISQLVTQLAPWCISDIYDQCGYGNATFHGNYGLLSLQGLRKPAYQVYRLLGRLGTQRVPTDEPSGSKCRGSIATLDGDRMSVLVYDYDHEESETGEPLAVEVALPGDVAPAATMLWKVDRTENNILANWRAMGSPDYLLPDQLTELREANELAPAREEAAQAGSSVSFRMETGSVALLEMEA